MLWKAFLFTTCVVGVFCSTLYLDDQLKQNLHRYIDAKFIQHNIKAPEVEQSMHSFIDCIYEHQDPSILRDLNKIEDLQSTIPIYKRGCKKVPEYKTCLYKMMDDIAVYREKDFANQITEVKKYLDELLEYLCGNDAKKFEDFVNDESLQCIGRKYDSLKTCTYNSFIKLGNSEEESIEPESYNAKLEDICSRFDDLSKCIHTALIDCPKPTASQFIDGMFAITRKFARCSKFD